MHSRAYLEICACWNPGMSNCSVCRSVLATQLVRLIMLLAGEVCGGNKGPGTRGRTGKNATSLLHGRLLRIKRPVTELISRLISVKSVCWVWNSYDHWVQWVVRHRYSAVLMPNTDRRLKSRWRRAVCIEFATSSRRLPTNLVVYKNWKLNMLIRVELCTHPSTVATRFPILQPTQLSS